MQESTAPEAPAPPASPGPAGPSNMVIAVDGPSGAGKSTVAREVAKRLGLRYLDTGAMYRAVTRRLLDEGVDLTDPAAVADAARRVDLRPGTDPAQPTVTADGQDLTAAVRDDAVTANVSAVSAVPAVRELLVGLQRRLIGAGGIVVEGRDIGTTVAPDAPVKIFLTADSRARAQRRTLELRSSASADGAAPDADQTEAALRRRDEQDSRRTVSPLTQATDAVVIDTTPMPVDQVVARVLEQVRQARAPGAEPSGTPPGGRGVARPAAPGLRSVQPRPKLIQPRGRRSRPLVKLGRGLGRLLVRGTVLRVTVVGAENMPAAGPVILAGNHTGFLDGPVVFSTAPRPAQFFIKEEMYEGRLARLLDWMGQIPVNRGRPDRPALRRGLAILAHGEAVGMFPEGTRGAGDLRTIQHGIGYLALKAGCPVVPVACFGTLDALPEHARRLKRGTPVDVVYGAPFRITPTGDPRTRRAVAEAAEEIRARLADHLRAAAALTGRRLPAEEGPDPAAGQDR